MTRVLIVLPVFAYILFTLVFYQKSSVKCVWEGLVKGHLAIFLLIAVSTELLSLFNQITFSVLLFMWLVFLLVGLIALSKHWKRFAFDWPDFKGAAPITKALIGAIIFILFITFITAIIYPPNTWDSMTYHMPRVLHWISNNNVSFYPTEITRQNYQMPLAEFAIMHLQLLTGGDWFANLVQWVSFLVLISLGVLVAAELGLNKKLQLITAVIIATLPMAVIQASSTQNDLVVSVFLMSFGLFMLRLRTNFSTENLLFAGVSLGLALLTKGTAYLYGAGLGIALALPLLLERRKHSPQFLKATAALVLVVIMALALNMGHLWRNHQGYGHPLSTEGAAYRNQDMSVAALASNIVRNGALHLGTPSAEFNEFQLQLTQQLLGQRLNDPKTTWEGASFSIPFIAHEDYTGNLIHFLIILLSVVLLIVAWCRGHHKRQVWYSLGVMLGLILYCWILRWQPWASRLHTPLFVLAAPLMAITITSGLATKRIGYLISLLMVLYSIPFALENMNRPLMSLDWQNIDRNRLYFQNRHSLFGDYNSAMEILRMESHGEVGLYLDQNDWEYPFWVLAGQIQEDRGSIAFRFDAVGSFSDGSHKGVFLPQYILATKPLESWKYAPLYFRIYQAKHVSVFKKR